MNNKTTVTGKNFGVLNEHALGMMLKEIVRRVIHMVQENLTTFEVRSKIGSDGKSEDIYTDIDKDGQELYLKLVQEAFPGIGIIAEEDNLSIPCELPGRDLYFTIDPIDGTRAFARGQSHGIGTQIALVEDEEVIAVCVGDIMTKEIFYYRPLATRSYRISRFNVGREMVIKTNKLLKKQHLLLRDLPEKYTPGARTLLELFHSAGTADGSIGLSMARLWKSEVGGKLLRGCTHNTPWDWNPVIGLSKKLGFIFFYVNSLDGRLEQFEPKALKKKVFVAPEVLIIHGSRAAEVSHLVK